VGEDQNQSTATAADFPADLKDKAAAAFEAEEKSLDKGIDAWRRLVQSAPSAWEPRRELARLYKKAKRMKHFADALADAADKVSWDTEAEKLEILWEMIEAYRSQNQDLKAVHGLNQVLAVDPRNMKAIEGLAAFHEKSNRWPDLIGVLRKKVSVVESDSEKIDLRLRIANLYVEKFSNQAEAIKEFEAVLELDGKNVAALQYLKQMYEKRRDWDKLIKLRRREIDALEDPDQRIAQLLEVAGLASEKLKRAPISIELWELVLQLSPQNEAALQQLERLYERDKNYERLAFALNERASLGADEAELVAVLTKLAQIYGDRLNDRAKAIDAWKRLLEIDSSNLRAQDTLKKLYVGAGDWASLEEFYASQNRFDEFVRVLEREADNQPDDQRIALLLKIADLYENKLQKSDRAQKAYEKTLAADPTNLAAASALVPLYEKGRDKSKLANALKVKLHHTESPEARQEAMETIASILEGPARNKPEALAMALQAFEELPSSAWAQQAIERLSSEAADPQTIADVYEKGRESLSGAAALPVLSALATLYQEQLGNAEKAIERNEQVLALEPGHEGALAALDSLYVSTGRFEELLAIYEKRLSLAASDEEKREVRFKLASVYENELTDLPNAIASYEALLEDAPSDLPTMRALDRLYLATGAHEKLARVIEKELEALDGGDAAELLVRLGAVKAQHLSDGAGALSAFKRALSLNPENEPAKQALVEYLNDSDLQLGAVEALEPLYDSAQDLDGLTRCQLIKLGHETDQSARVALYLRVGELEGARGRTDEAFNAYANAFKEDPNSTDARSAFEDLCAILDRWEPLVELYGQALESGKLESDLERETLSVLARTYDERLGAPDKAVAYFERAQELAPEEPAALEALENLYTRTENWAELIGVLKKKTALAPDEPAKLELYTRIARIAEETLDNPSEAISAWQKVLSSEPSHLRALRALDGLFVRTGQDSELADNLQRQLDLATEAEDVVTLLGRLGALRHKTGEIPAAIETYRRLLDIEPAHDDTVSALEALLQNEEHELELAEMLEPVYRARNEFARLVSVHEILVKSAANPEQKIQRLHEIAACFEDGLDDPSGAYDAMARAFKEDPMNAETQQSIERLARTLGRMEVLIELYIAQASAVEDTQLKRLLLHRVAQIATVEIGRDDIAADAYLSAIEVQPTDVEAADALINIYTTNADYENLVVAYERKISMISDAEERKALGIKAAGIYEEVLDKPQQAIDVFKGLLEVDDTDLTVIDSLVRLYLRLERWSDLKDIYSRKADLSQTPEDKKSNLYVLGQLYDVELDDPERAIDTYTSVLDIDPDDYDASQALERLYTKTERWYDLLAVLERQTELSSSGAEVVSVRFQIGELWRHKLQDLARATESYRQVLEMDPTHQQTIEALESMMRGNSEPVLAAQVLRPIYESGGDWQSVVSVDEVMVANTEDPPRKLELLASIADIQERRLANHEAAFEAYGRSLEVEPTHAEAVAHLDRLAEVTGNWERLAGLYEAQLEHVLDAHAQVDMLMRVARIYEQELADTDRAIVSYKRVCDAEPDRTEGLRALDRLYTATSQWEQLAEVLRREIRLADTEEEIISLTFRLAQVLETSLGDVSSAVESYQDILNADPAHAETRLALERLLQAGQMQAEIIEILEPLYRLGEEWDKLAELYQVELERVESNEEKITTLRRLSEISEKRLNDQFAAFDWMARLVLEDPGSTEGREQLLRLARATGNWEGFEHTLQRAAQEATQAEVRRSVQLQLASTYETELANLPNAEAVLLQILGEDERDDEALAFLDRLYLAQGSYDALAQIIDRRIELAEEPLDLVSLNLRLGKLKAEMLGDVEGAVAAYNRVLEFESRSNEALEALESLYVRTENWTDLYATYEKMVDIAPGDRALSDCYARMATITSEVFGDPDKALELWQRVLDLRGTDLVALENLADLLEAAGEWRDLTDILESQIRLTDDIAIKVPLYKRLGRIWGEQLSRERNALDCWQAVLDLDPQDPEALMAIAANYRSAGAWEELSETLRRLIELGPTLDPADLKDLYAQLGELEGDTLMRKDAAIAAWQAVLSLDPRDFRAMAALESLYEGEGLWAESVQLLEARAAAQEEPHEKAESLMQAAHLWSERLEDSASAAAVYERLLEIDPGNLPASNELETLYRQQENWEPLIGLLFSRVEILDEARARQDCLVAAAQIFESKLGNPDQAFDVLETAFQLDFSNDHVAEELERLAREAGKWNDLITSWEGVAQAEEDKSIAADLWVKIARWYDSALQNTDEAIRRAYYAWQLDPTNTSAMGAMADFYAKQGKWAEFVQTLRERAKVEVDPEKKVGVLVQLADAYETQIGDAAQAAVYFEQALEEDERCGPALDALERLYRRLDAGDRLVQVLSKKAHAAEDGEQAVAYSLQVGELWEQRLGDNLRAIEAYREVLTVDPQNVFALDALERLYAGTQQREQQLEIIEHRLEVLDDDSKRIEEYFKMADMWENHFGKPERAVENLQKILLVDPSLEPVYRSLERLYTQAKQWEDLVESYRNHIDVATDQSERVQLYFKMGQVYENEIRDIDRAIDSYDSVLTFDGQHVDSLWALSRLYEEIEDWDRAVDVMQRIVDVVEGTQKVDLNYRLGRIFDEQMRMPEEAEVRLNEALALDPTHVACMTALINLYRNRGEPLKAAQLMVRAEEHTTNTLEKTRLLSEAGRIYLYEIQDESNAMQLFARTVEIDPEHADAAEPLADIYWSQKNWEGLVPLLEMLVRKTERHPVREMHPFFFRLASACAQLGEDEKSLAYYKRAHEIDPTHLPTLMGRAELLFKRQQWDEAFKLYQTILVHHRDSQRDEDVVEIFWRIGNIKLQLGERSKAVNFFEKALELNPGHAPTLEALVGIYAEAGDWDSVIKQRRVLLTYADSKSEKLDILDKIIAVYKEELKDPQHAIAAYLEAIDIEPESPSLLNSVLELFTQTAQWKKAVEITMRLADLNTGRIKAKYMEAAGNFTRDMLRSPDEAIEIYNRALDVDPSNLKLFERIDKILTNKKDWKNQERNYRKMIKRLGEVNDENRGTAVALWHALGEIYRSRLKDYRAAIQAFEVCSGLAPEALGRKQILAELYQVAGPDYHEKAVATYRGIIAETSDLREAVGPMRVLRKMFSDAGQHDRAWCAAQVLSFLRGADDQERQFFEQHRSKGLARARARLTEEMWQGQLYHSDEDPYVSQITAAVVPAVLQVHARAFKDLGIRPRDYRDPSDPLAFMRVFSQISGILGVPQPRVYLKEELQFEMEVFHLQDKKEAVTALVVGGAALQGRTEKELAFMVGRRSAMLRADHLIRWEQVVPTAAELKGWVVATLKSFKPELPVPPEMAPHMGSYMDVLRNVPPQNMERLGVVVRKMFESGHDISTTRWIKAVDFTAARAGLLMCGDLEVAARLIQSEPMKVGMAEPHEKIRDLIEWTLSDSYFKLREQLGLQIG